jgi:hypothetical protein
MGVLMNCVNTNNFIMSKNDVNIIYFPVGNLPSIKADEYLNLMEEKFKNQFPEYDVFLIKVNDNMNMLNNMTLSKDDVNLIYIPMGKLPKQKAEEYLKNIMKKFSEKYSNYKMFYIAI